MLQASGMAALTGRTISAAIRRTPTMRIESATVTAASAATETFRAPTGSPRHALPPRRARRRQSAR